MEPAPAYNGPAKHASLRILLSLGGDLISRDLEGPGGNPPGPSGIPKDRAWDEARKLAARLVVELRQQLLHWEGVLTELDEIAPATARVSHPPTGAEDSRIDEINRDFTDRPSLNSISRKRFSEHVVPIADALILERGRPVPVDDVLSALPPDVRADLEAASLDYSAGFRIRRMFRRNSRYIVTDEGVTFAHPPPKSDRVWQLQKVITENNEIRSFEIINHNGEVVRLNASRLASELENGREILLPEHYGRRSRLRLSVGKLYSEFDGVENNDYSHFLRRLSFEEISEDPRLL